MSVYHLTRKSPYPDGFAGHGKSAVQSLSREMPQRYNIDCIYNFSYFAVTRGGVDNDEYKTILITVSLFIPYECGGKLSPHYYR